MRLMTWTADGVRKLDPAAPPFPPVEEGQFWLDLDLRVDPVEEVLGAVLGGAVPAVELNEPHARAKILEAGDHLYALLHEAEYDAGGEILVTNAHFFLGRRFLVTVRTAAPQGLDLVWGEEPREVAQKGLDHLFFLIADAMVERSFPALDAIAEAVETAEDDIFPHPREGVQSRIFDLRKDLLDLRRTIGPMREVFAFLTRRENPIVDREDAYLLAEVYDHLVRLYELIDAQRDLLGSLTEVYLTGLSNRLNETMKTLTVIATIMMPLTLIVGIYGMNFRHMPELRWRYGYPAVIALMLLVAGGMVRYFRRRRWF